MYKHYFVNVSCTSVENGQPTADSNVSAVWKLSADDLGDDDIVSLMFIDVCVSISSCICKSFTAHIVNLVIYVLIST